MKTLEDIKRSAEAGIMDAQAILGWMYKEGCSVEQNISLAKNYLSKSAAQGCESSVMSLKSLAGAV